MKISQLPYRYNKRKHIIIISITTIVITILIYSQLFGVLYVPNTSIIDFKVLYSYQTFQTAIQSLTIEQAHAYQWIHVIDYLFMLLFYPLLVLLLSTVIKQQSKQSIILFIPLFGYIFDLIENICIDIHLYQYPELFQVVGHIAVIVTPLKFLMSLLAILIYMYKKVIEKK